MPHDDSKVEALLEKLRPKAEKLRSRYDEINATITSLEKIKTIHRPTPTPNGGIEVKDIIPIDMDTGSEMSDARRVEIFTEATKRADKFKDV